VFEHESGGCFQAKVKNELDDSYLAALGLTHRVSAWRQAGQIVETSGAQAHA
jgi:hypothetical protein